MSPEKMTQWQKDALAGFAEQQESYLGAIAAWRKAMSAATPAGATPAPPTTPIMDASFSANEVVDANRAFMEAVFKQQQDFLEKLTRTLGSDG